MIGCYGIGNRLEQHGFSRPRRGHDQAALSFSDRREKVEDAGRKVVLPVRRLELQSLVRIQRRQVIEEDLVAGLVWMFEVDGLNFDQCKIAFAVLRSAYLS